MIKQLLILAGGVTLTVAASFAQISHMGSAFQQPGWMAAPGYPTFQPDAQTGPVTGKPFSGTETRHSTQTLADGTHVQDSSTSLFYRDTQGRMRSESPTFALIYDAVAGFTYQLDLRNKRYDKSALNGPVGTVSIFVIGNHTSISSHSSTTTTTSSGHSTAQPHDEAAQKKAERKNFVSGIHSQAVNENLPPQMVNGVFCRGSRITETIPAGTFGNDRDVKITSERWYSDDLQVLVKTSNSDPRFGVTTYELTNIVQAPPDPTLFLVPADYTARPVHTIGGGFPNQSK